MTRRSRSAQGSAPIAPLAIAEPTAAEVRAAAMRAGLTQAQAAAAVGADLRTWQRWESGERRMSVAVWALFQARAGLLSLDDLGRTPGLP